MNRGIAPLDPETEVGQLRLNVGDTESVPFDPDEPGFGQYGYFSDAELEELLSVSNDSITRATGYAYRKLAGFLALSAVNIQTDDLRISTIERAKLMRELAADWLSSAEDEDNAAGADIFDVVPFAGATPSYVPEGTPYPLIGRPYWP